MGHRHMAITSMVDMEVSQGTILHKTNMGSLRSRATINLQYVWPECCLSLFYTPYFLGLCIHRDYRCMRVELCLGF